MQQLTPQFTPKYQCVRVAGQSIHHNTTKPRNHQATPALPQNQPQINLKKSLETGPSSRKFHKTEPNQTAKIGQMEHGTQLVSGHEHAHIKI